MEPDDPFVIYAMAMEWMDENPEKTKELLDVLLKDHKDYVGTYYHAAALYSSEGQREKAEDIYRKGISVAEKAGDHHALRELKSAYNEFLFEDEE